MVHVRNSRHMQDSEQPLPPPSNAKLHYLVLVLDEVHTNHHCSRAEAEIAASAPQSPSSNQQSTTEAQVKHQGAGMLPLNPPTNKDSSCYGVDPAQPTRKKTPNAKFAESPKPARIYSFRALIQVMNRLGICSASTNCQRLQSREQHS